MPLERKKGVCACVCACVGVGQGGLCDFLVQNHFLEPPSPPAEENVKSKEM